MYVDPVLAVGLAMTSGALLRHHAVEVLALAVAVACLVCVHVTKGRALLLVSLVVLGLGGGWLRAHRAIVAHEDVLARLEEDAPGLQRCDGTARVVGSPVRVGGSMRWLGEVTDASCGERTMRTPFHASFYDTDASGEPVARGDRMAFVAQLGPPERLTNFDTSDPLPAEVRRGAVRSGGLLDRRLLARGRGPPAWIDRARAAVRVRIDATFPADTAPMARAMVLGENDLTPDDGAAFRGSGLSHLLAVSGMHLVLVVLGLTRLLRALFIRIEPLSARIDAGRLADAVGIVISFVYADFAGSSGSALRAAWMTSVLLLARLLARRGDGARALGLSIVGMAWLDPLVAYDLSFVLSVLATAGLFVFRPAMADAFAGALRLPGKLAQPLAATLGATVACAPVTSLLSTTLPLGGVLANLLAVPVGEIVSLPLCLVHALLAPLPMAERGCAWVASLALATVRGIARLFARIGWLSIEVPPPTSAQLAVLAFAFLAWVFLQRSSRRYVVMAACLALCAALEFPARREGAPSGKLRITFLDVGQGDAALIDLPNGDAMMIDGGGIVGSPVDVGARVIAPTLRARRREALELVVLSHPHPDHFGGLPTGLDGIAVRALWDTGQGEREGTGGAYATLLRTARARGTLVQRPETLCGVHAIGGVTVEVLAPCPEASPDRGPNDNSFVLRIGYGSRHILFTGDAEGEEEGDLLRLPAGALRADVLKVGHHGSRTSTSRTFVAAIRPQWAVISSGARNRFGHPAGVTLATLHAAGVRTYRTDRDGAIVLETDGRSLSMRSAE